MSNLRTRLSTTPGRLRALRAACIAGAVCMALVVYWAYWNVWSAVRTVGRDTVPSIVAAELIRAKLADANANAMNAILTGEKDNGQFWKSFRDEMDQVHDALITATQNITYGDEERKPILAMMAKLGEYENTIGRVRGDPGGPEGRKNFLAANAIMRGDILPASIALDKANFSHLNAAYDKHRGSVAAISALCLCAALVLLAVFVATQAYLFRRMHRIVNPGLFVATIVLLGFSAYCASVLGGVETNLVSAKQDAFDSIHALWQARAVTYDGNADESLYLLLDQDKNAQAKSTKDFQAKAAQLTDVDPRAALQKARRSEKFGGFLGEELGNITFAGEREAALATLEGWALYIGIDAKIRDLEEQGRYKEALELDIGAKPGQSNWAFDQFDKGLDRVLGINQREFEHKINHAFSILDVFPYALACVFVAMIAASVLGMKARIDEYRF